MTADYRQILRERILDEATFVRATFSGKNLPWRKLVLRPVLLKTGRHLQFSYFDDKKDVTKNYAGDELIAALDEALALPFINFVVQSSTGDVQVQITKKGKALIHHSRTAQPREPDLAHDHEKASVLPASDPYLQAVGIMTHDGKIKAGMHSKYKQINEFLKLIEETGALDHFEQIRVLDAGCGNAYLTFALYHYLTAVRGLTVEMVGVDVKADLMAKHTQNAQALGWTGLHFVTSNIIDYQPTESPDMVVALHACDTATDEAMAQGIRWGSTIIVCAPCCQHNLQEQLRTQPTPQPFAPVLRYGILHERLGDVLTDSFRALTLRMMGYRTDVMQFIGDEHTPKNIMIRAVKALPAGEPKFAQEYTELKEFWGVTPYLEGLLSEP